MLVYKENRNSSKKKKIAVYTKQHQIEAVFRQPNNNLMRIGYITKIIHSAMIKKQHRVQTRQLANIFTRLVHAIIILFMHTL
jgi:hypothetical protein